MKKILFVLENYWPLTGGVETLFLNLTEGLAKHGHQITILTGRPEGTKKYEVKNGVKIHRVDLPSFASRYFFTFFAIPKAIKLAKKADAIHTTTYNAAAPAWTASKITGTKSVITIHEVLGEDWEKFAGFSPLSAKLHKFLETLILLLPFDHHVAVSNSTAKRINKFFLRKKNVSVVYNGIDYNFWNTVGLDRDKIRKKLGWDKKFVVFAAGRPGLSKGFEYLAKSWGQVSKHIRNASLVLALSNDESFISTRGKIEKVLKKEKKVKLTPSLPIKNLREHIFAADCAVVPSLTEGFGYAAAEVCTMKTPLVATNTTSLPEVVSEKFILVQSRSPKAIAEGIIKVNRKQWTKTRLKKFTIETMVKNYEKLYQKLV